MNLRMASVPERQSPSSSRSSRRCNATGARFRGPSARPRRWTREHPGLVVKDRYWRWHQRKLAGNAIDFRTQVLRLSLHDAMRELIAS